MENLQVKRGLRPTPKDERDAKLGAMYTLPDVASLPYEFILPHYIYDQKDSDFCSGCMTCQMSYPQEGVVLSPEYSFAVSKELSGDVDEWGQDLRSACKSHQKVGALSRVLAPFTFEDKDPEFLRHIENWSVAQGVHAEDIASHKKKSYFKVAGPYDHFDDIRASIFKFQSGVGSGVDWGWPLSQVVLDTIPTEGSGHAITYVGWTEGGRYLWLANSYGKDAGYQGLHRVSRNVVNHFVEVYGAYMFVDIPWEKVRYHMEVGTSPEMPWPKQIFISFINLFR